MGCPSQAPGLPGRLSLVLAVLLLLLIIPVSIIVEAHSSPGLLIDTDSPLRLHTESSARKGLLSSRFKETEAPRRSKLPGVTQLVRQEDVLCVGFRARAGWAPPQMKTQSVEGGLPLLTPKGVSRILFLLLTPCVTLSIE